jgi:hypothetical protein
VTPAMIESSLLVVEAFRDSSGFEWKAGDRALLRNRHVREAALANPSWFRIEFETADVDLAWLRELDAGYEAEFIEAKRRRDERKAREKRAVQEELKAAKEAQDSAEQKRLKRALEQQEREKEEAVKRLQEERERRAIETELAYFGGQGFHH